MSKTSKAFTSDADYKVIGQDLAEEVRRLVKEAVSRVEVKHIAAGHNLGGVELALARCGIKARRNERPTDCSRPHVWSCTKDAARAAPSPPLLAVAPTHEAHTCLL